MNKDAPLTALDVTFSYNKGNGFHFPSFVLPTGAHCVIAGNSGSGKTTFIHLLCGLLRPSSGEVRWGDVCINRLTDRRLDRLRGQYIGLIFQQIHLIKSLTVLENLAWTQVLAGLRPDLKYQQSVLKLLDIEEKANNYPRSLSQGQLQRAAIARALINKPKILLADEPTSALDDANAERVLDLLIQQADQHQATLLVATHDQRVKNRISTIYQL